MPGWIARSLVLVSLLGLGFAAGPSSGSETPLPTYPRVLTSEQRLERSLAARRLEIASYRRLTWACQEDLGEARTRAPLSIWGIRGLARRTRVRELWRVRFEGCRDERSRRTIPSTKDWGVAVALVQRIYPGTARWLLACSSGEGGHGDFVMNHQGSGASGWMQYLPSTFYSHVGEAYRDARDRGFRIDPRTASIYHPVGQAVTAAYMRTHGMSSHWDPNIDYLCR